MTYKYRTLQSITYKILCSFITLLLFLNTDILGQQGNIKTIAGNLDTSTTNTFYGDGRHALEAGIYHPRSVWKDHASNIYIADTDNHRIRKITPDGNITTIAGNGTEGFSGNNGIAIESRLSNPYDICGDNQGNIYFADMGNNRIRKINENGALSTVAGNGESLPTISRTVSYDGPAEPSPTPADVKDERRAIHALLKQPMGICLDNLGNLFIADTGHHRIRKVDLNTGIITTIAGVGFGPSPAVRDGGSITVYRIGGFDGDGRHATKANLNHPIDICVDKNGHLYIADAGNHRIRKVDASTGIINTIAGDGQAFRAEIARFGGPPIYIGKFVNEADHALASSLNFPMSVAISETGLLFIADAYNHRIRVMMPQHHVLKTIAGSSHWGSVDQLKPFPDYVTYHVFINNQEVGGYEGDGGPAADAKLNLPSRLFLDQHGDLFIADAGNSRLRVIESIEHAIMSQVKTVEIKQSDFNQDNTVNFQDFVIFAAHFNTQIGDPSFNQSYDLNTDGIIDFFDFLGFAENFGKSSE